MRRWRGIAGIVVLLVGAFVAGLFFHTRTSTTTRAVPVVPPPPPRSAGVVDEVRYHLQTAYYRDLDSDILDLPTVDEMLAALHDPYTEYLSPQDYAQLEASTSGRYNGVGLTVGPAKNGLRVMAAAAGPAREAGIRRGDIIVSVDGRPTGQMQFVRSLYLFQGREGTRVHLTVRRPNRGRLDFVIVRKELPAPTSRSRMLSTRAAPLAYVRLLSFSRGSAKQLRDRASSLVQAGARGIVVDLRDNPGGYLAEAVQSASVFLRHGVVCTTEGAHERRVFEVTGSTALPRIPVVVLIDRGTASASEILAAGLADNDRVTLVGQRSYGKAAVQDLRELTNGAALKLTTATYLTPDGNSLLGRGVHPSVRALDDPKTRPDEALLAAERVLTKHIG